MSSNLNALSAAMNAEQDVAVRALKIKLAEQQLALERARMSAEDARSAMLCPDGKTDWRQHCSLQRMILNRHSVDPAIDYLQEARHEILVALSDPRRDSIAALSASYNASSRQSAAWKRIVSVVRRP